MVTAYYNNITFREPERSGPPKKGLGFFKEIEAPEIMEILSEEFGIFPFDCMEECKCFAYGGALRDAVAGLPIGGDLDIATNRGNHRVLRSRFDENPKFARCVKQKLEDGSEKTVWLTKGSSGLLMKMPKAGYNQSNVPMNDEDRFLRYDGAEINLVSAKRFQDSEYEDALHIVMNVDMICCGLAMDGSGHLYELVEGAYEDCQNRVLRLNPKSSAAISVERTEKRIKRLEERGWKSEIDLSDLKKREEQARAMEKAERAKAPKKRKKSPPDKLEKMKIKLRNFSKRREKLHQEIREMVDEGVPNIRVRRAIERRDKLSNEIFRLNDEITAIKSNKKPEAVADFNVELRFLEAKERQIERDLHRAVTSNAPRETIEELEAVQQDTRAKLENLRQEVDSPKEGSMKEFAEKVLGPESEELEFQPKGQAKSGFVEDSGNYTLYASSSSSTNTKEYVKDYAKDFMKVIVGHESESQELEGEIDNFVLEHEPYERVLSEKKPEPQKKAAKVDDGAVEQDQRHFEKVAWYSKAPDDGDDDF